MQTEANHTDPAGAPTHTPPAARRSRTRRALRAFAWTVLGLFVAVLLLGAGAWWWLGSNKSLAFALAQAAQRLPAGQTLESRDVTGSLRTGGHIGWLSTRARASRSR